MSAMVVLPILLGARGAIAGTIVFDPAPLTGTRSSDLPETGSGMNEHYQFGGTARNDGSAPATLAVIARRDGQDIPASRQSFTLSAAGTTQFSFDYTDAGNPAPASVGLTFSTDVPLAFVAGAFTFTHQPPEVPAVPTPAIVGFGLALLVVGWARSRGP
jgi:hypothetical protein